jgi:SNF2 family DNA or RNA helicase
MFPSHDRYGKVIIWARFRREIRDVYEALTKMGVLCVEYHGGTSTTQRLDNIEAFENGDARVFIGQQQAGGTGITLVAASHVIYYSNDFSLRNRLQSEDRAHRIGQTRNVTYTDLAAIGTIDEAVARSLQNKLEVAEAVVNELRNGAF